MTTTGTVGSDRLMPVSRSRPSTPFIRRSVTTTSAGAIAKRSSAAAPLDATSVLKPADSRALALVWAMSTTSSTTRARSLAMGGARLRDRGPQHRRGRSRSGWAGEVDVPAVVPHDAGGDGKAEARSLAALLGGEERVEHRVHVLGRDAAAVVDDLDANHSVSGGLGGEAHPTARLGRVAA